MSNLPKEWLEVEIGEIAIVVGGGTPTANDESNFAEPGTAIAWLTPADLSGYKCKEIAQGKRDLSQKGLKGSSANLMPKNSILFSSRAPIGYVAIAKNEIATNQGFKSFVFTNHIDSSFAYYYLKSIRSLAESRGTGTTFKELSGSAAKKLPFLIAPLNEQIRIADKLDSVLAKVNAAQARLEKIPTLLKRFRQSVLAAATSGELTREWREENLNSNEIWERTSIGGVIKTGPQNGIYKPATLYGSGTKIVRIDGFYDGKMKSWQYLKRVEISEAERFTWGLSEGDVLINRVNSIEYLGKCGLVEEIPEPTVFESNIMRISLNERVIPKYLIVFLISPIGRLRITENAKHAVNQASINQTDVKSCAIELPCIDEQKEIVRRVESLFAQADAVEKQYHAAKQRLDRLSQSLLAKAFRGELVPQDPNDEPAAELLKRIQAERVTQAPSKRQRKPAL